ncbi:hypothetical protein BFR04_00640 [Gaetbulibacter sp. 4G1]|nr:hypothetical protein BFR04_00640 [Gaetbulibacter sp. 4G1]
MENYVQMNKKLLFITPIFKKDINEDNVVPFICLFTQNFNVEKNVDIDVLSLMYPFTKKKYKINNINVYPIGGNFNKSLRQIPMLLKAILKGLALCRKNKYDGILCFWYRESALVGLVLSKVFKLKLLVWMHGQDINKSNKYIKLLKIPKHKLVMISSIQRDLFYKFHNIRVQKIANNAVFKELFPSINTSRRAIDIIGVGSLGVLKNYSFFIDIVHKLNINDLKCIIIGGGEEMDNLKEQIIRLNLSNNITLLGRKTHKEVLKYLNNSKLFLHTSKFEGNASVLQEALYSGCNVVSSIDLESSINIEPFFFSVDENKIIEKIKYYLNNTKNYKRIEHFKIENTYDVFYNSFYND